jgi:ubiquinone/menaquinone biosynthesis C-methylase UbiE
MNEPKIKQNVREFYDEIGWKLESDGYYQNARYEDLRPVSAEYIHRCHMRITPYFAAGGKYLLDAGSGPIQYPEYLTYSEHFEKRVCVDISITALKDARKRIGSHGFFVVADVANLPFSSESFDGIVSLHTLHHLPLDEQKNAWFELFRTLKTGKIAIVVNGWTESEMMKRWQSRVETAEKAGRFIARLRGKEKKKDTNSTVSAAGKGSATGTFVKKLDAGWLKRELAGFGENVTIEIRCWRSVSVRWLRALIHAPYGKMALRHLFNLEEKKTAYYGEYGQYPMIIIHKKQTSGKGKQ